MPNHWSAPLGTLVLACAFVSGACAQSSGISREEVSRLTSTGQWLTLRTRMDEAIRADDPELNAYYLRGVAKLNLLDPAGAIDDLEKGTQAAPDAILTWMNLGRAYRAAGKAPQAERAFLKALALRPDYPSAVAYLWELYDSQGRDADTAALAQKAAGVKNSSFEWIAHQTKGSALWPMRPSERPAAPVATGPLKSLDAETARLIAKGDSLWKSGDFRAAASLLEPRLAAWEREYGRFHPDILKASTITMIATAEGMDMAKAAGFLSLGRNLEQVIILARENLARRISANGQSSEAAAVAQFLLAYAEYENYNLDEAVADAVACRERVQALKTPNPTLALWADVMFSLVLSRRGQPEEAIALGRDVTARAFAQMGKDNFLPYVAVQSLGYEHMAAGQVKPALESLEQALEGFQRLLPPGHRTTVGTLSTMLPLLAANGQGKRADALYEDLLRIVRQRYGPQSPEEMDTLSYRAANLVREQRYAEAIPLLNQALARSVEIWGPESLQVAQGKMSLVYAHGLLGNLGAARRIFQEVEPLLEAEVRRADASDPSVARRYSDVSVFYRFYASAAIYRDPVEAFKYAELSKARTLLEASALSNGAKNGLLPAAEQRQLDSLSSELAINGASLGGAANDLALRTHYEAQRQVLQRKFKELVARLKREHPKFRDSIEVQTVEARTGMDLLDDATAFISFAVSGNTVMAFGLSRQSGLEAVRLDDIPDLPGRIEDIRAQLDPGRMDERGFNYAAPGNIDLSSRLLSKLAKTLRGKKRLLISPDGPLAFLPFDVLTYDGRPLIETFDISYTPSLSVFRLMQVRAAEYQGLARKSLFSIGGAEYQSADTATTRGARLSRQRQPDDLVARLGRAISGGEAAKAKRRAYASAQSSAGQAGSQGMKTAFRALDVQWENLPGTIREVEGVARLFPAGEVTTATRENATEQNLQRLNSAGTLASYRYLHFAAHGYLNPEEPALNAIVLGQLHNPSGVDGFVTAREWPLYDLKSDLVFMSACETGVGRFVDGTGVTGLPYALYVAGNTSLVLTLWQVVDDATSDFVVSFFSKVRAGQSKSAALSQTKREFLASGKRAHPAYWAGFVYYGD
jgi:CHAT domain-containing protein/cytochrome c-type biogenesis protein CcmH/NrfG